MFGPFGRYISEVPDGDVLGFLEGQRREALKLLQSLPEKESLVLHAPYTWTLREVMGHITDAERIFAYRALRFGRGDGTPLPSFDENAYVQAANFNQWPFDEVLGDFDQVRQSTLRLFRHFDASAWQRTGTASGIQLTPAALAYVIGGHAQHHLAIIRQRLQR
jgi:hypothetical protein